MLKEKLEAAIAKRDSDVTTFVWKGRKVEINGHLIQEEKHLIDCSERELKEFYKHCESMLKNDSKEYPGRYILLDIIEDQRNRCNAELFLRWLESEKLVPRFTFMGSLRKALDTNSEYIEFIGGAKAFLIKEVLGECPAEFINLPSDVILEGCLDKLGKFNKQHITLTFILKQGLWFTPQESKDLTEKDSKGITRERAEVAKERLGLKPNVNLYMTPKGLSYGQLRSMINLKSKKYSELTTDQLKVLRNRILFSLEDDVKFHVGQWEARKKQIEMTCDALGFTL